MDRNSLSDIIVRRNYRAELQITSWARATTKHRVSRERARYVIESCEIYFEFEDPDRRDPRLLFVGDDQEEVPLEVIAVRLDGLRVIHAMPLRQRYTKYYERAMRWQARKSKRN